MGTEASAMRLTSSIFLLLTLVAFGMTFYVNQPVLYFVFGGSQTTYQTTTHWVLALCLHFPVILLFLLQLWATCSPTINAMGIGNSQVFGFPGRRMLLGIAVEPSFNLPQYGNGAFGNPYNQNAVAQGFGGFHDHQLHPQDVYAPRSPV